MAIDITGMTPSIPFGSKIEIPDYEEEYYKTGPGIHKLMYSHSILTHAILMWICIKSTNSFIAS